MNFCHFASLVVCPASSFPIYHFRGFHCSPTTRLYFCMFTVLLPLPLLFVSNNWAPEDLQEGQTS